jgi:hypothetical protein
MVHKITTTKCMMMFQVTASLRQGETLDIGHPFMILLASSQERAIIPGQEATLRWM